MTYQWATVQCAVLDSKLLDIGHEIRVVVLKKDIASQGQC